MELIVHPRELTRYWVDLAKKMKLERVGIHPVGGMKAHESLKLLMEEMKDPFFREMVDELRGAGIRVGYSFHALSYLLPRELFEEHPEYFRMDQDGKRTTRGNFCFSNEKAREIICNHALRLAEELYGSDEEYDFWLDDATKLSCHCEECKKHSFATHQLRLMNEMVRVMRKKIPGARLSYLAYYEGVAVPEILPEEGVFLEYAPFERYKTPEKFSFSPEYLALISSMVAHFGRENSKVLEYWYDNSIYYRRAGNRLVPFQPNNERIREDFLFYRRLGFERLSSFACNLDDDYRALFGEADFSALLSEK